MGNSITVSLLSIDNSSQELGILKTYMQFCFFEPAQVIFIAWMGWGGVDGDEDGP